MVCRALPRHNAHHAAGLPGQPLGSVVEEKVQNALQNCSGGNFDNFIHKEFSGKIPYYAVLAKGTGG